MGLKVDIGVRPTKNGRTAKTEGQVNGKILAGNSYCYIFIECYVLRLLFMRFPRVKAEGQSFYHCISRVVEGRFIFGSSGHPSLAAEIFLSLMRSLEAFSGVRVLTYALMGNHFHLL